MRLLVAAVGRLKAGPERDLAARYRERAAQLGRGLGFPACDIVEIPESRARRRAGPRAEEGGGDPAPTAAAGSVLVAFDERGRADLAERGAWPSASAGGATPARPALVVAIGGAGRARSPRFGRGPT